MKPGKSRKDRPKGPKSFSRGGSKRVERSAVARPEKEMIAEKKNVMTVKDLRKHLGLLIAE